MKQNRLRPAVRKLIPLGMGYQPLLTSNYYVSYTVACGIQPARTAGNSFQGAPVQLEKEGVRAPRSYHPNSETENDDKWITDKTNNIWKQKKQNG